jgi:spore coat polysaccharide biosynthesis protein SpsF
LLKLIIEYFGGAYPFFSCAEIIDLLRKQPDWLQINRHVLRKGDT